MASGDRLEALAALVLTLGLRRGEALGLRWTDVDLDAKTLTVGRNLPRGAGPGTCDDQAEDHLRAGPAWQEKGWVFTTPLGMALDPRNALRWWHGLCEGAGLGRRRFHAAVCRLA